jgi:EpsI family protein
VNARLWIVTLLFALGYAARLDFATPETAPARAPLSQFPASIERWTGRAAPPLDATVLSLLGTSDYLNRYYDAAGQAPVSLYIGYYRSQRQGEAMHSPMNCLPGAGWQPLTLDRIAIAEDDLVNRVVIHKGSEQQVVVYWYQSSTRIIASEYWSKFYLVADAFRSGRTDAAFVRLVSPVVKADDGENRAASAAIELGRLVRPRIQSHLFD